jgi:hypothetical protein
MYSLTSVSFFMTLSLWFWMSVMVGHRLARVQLDDLALSAVVGLLVVGDPFLSADSVSSVLPVPAILIVGTGKNDYRSTGVSS